MILNFEGKIGGQNPGTGGAKEIGVVQRLREKFESEKGEVGRRKETPKKDSEAGGAEAERNRTQKIVSKEARLFGWGNGETMGAKSSVREEPVKDRDVKTTCQREREFEGSYGTRIARNNLGNQKFAKKNS